MQLVTNLDNADDVRKSIAFLTKHLAPTPSVAEDALEDLRSRIGNSLRQLVQKAMDYDDWTDIATMAADLGRDYHSVRASLNGPLARALRSVKTSFPSAPDLFEWRQKGDRSYQFKLTPEMRAGLAARPLEFHEVSEVGVGSPGNAVGHE
jgi:hypothetical protein